MDYSPLKVSGDSVVVVNAIHVKFSGHTWDTKVYKFPRKSEGAADFSFPSPVFCIDYLSRLLSAVFCNCSCVFACCCSPSWRPQGVDGEDNNGAQPFYDCELPCFFVPSVALSLLSVCANAYLLTIVWRLFILSLFLYACAWVAFSLT